jgi:hypothetical protein
MSDPKQPLKYSRMYSTVLYCLCINNHMPLTNVLLLPQNLVYPTPFSFPSAFYCTSSANCVQYGRIMYYRLKISHHKNKKTRKQNNKTKIK